ncbi:MAG: isocitrate/isopropylmalate family dehydrogenase [Acidobacteriota bacterium]
MPRIALLPGDGIGPEVTAEVVKVLEALRSRGVPLEWDAFGSSADTYLTTGSALPEDVFQRLSEYDAIFAGAFGDPRIPDSAHAREILLGLRFRLDLYVNLRPVRLLCEEHSPLRNRGVGDVDFLLLRENTEGPYVGAGGGFKTGTPDEVATDVSLATRRGVERILRFAFSAASSKPRRRLAMADKHNALQYTSGLWYRMFTALRDEYPDVDARHFFADNLACQMVLDPTQFEVIVTDNLFGDLLSDLGAALAGGLGLAPSANLNPETGKALFEPVHGSAPDLAGEGTANPSAALLSAALMLDHLRCADWGSRLREAVRACLRAGRTTCDLGGALSTAAAGDAVVGVLLDGMESP